MDWSRGYTAKTYISIVDRNSWLDVSTRDIVSGSIQRSTGDLRQSASLTCVDYRVEGEEWVRIWLQAKQGQDSERVALFTGLATTPGRNLEGYFETNSLQCYSVLKPAQDILLPPGWYAPVGADGVALAKELLSVTPAPVVSTEGSALLQEAIIAENNESNLTMALAIIDAIGWVIKIDGMGVVTIAPADDSTVAIFDAMSNDIVEPKVTIDFDWFSCPNVFRATTSDGLVAIARDDADDSSLSIQNRGREVWAEETNVNLSTDITLGEYAINRLKDLQMVSTQISYERRFLPGVDVGDRVAISYPSHSIDGVFYVTSQTIELGYGARTSEEAFQV